MGRFAYALILRYMDAFDPKRKPQASNRQVDTTPDLRTC